MGFFEGLVTGLTGDASVYDNSNSDGNGVGDFLGGLVGGFLGALGSSDDDREPTVDEWIDSFKDEVNAEYVYFYVKHKMFQKTCILQGGVFDEDGEILDSHSWELPYDEDVKKLHDQRFDIPHYKSIDQMYKWVLNFNHNPKAYKSYSTVKHTPGVDEAVVTFVILDKNDNPIATENFIGDYDDVKELHKDLNYFPIGGDNNSSNSSSAADDTPQKEVVHSETYENVNPDEFAEVANDADAVRNVCEQIIDGIDGTITKFFQINPDNADDEDFELINNIEEYMNNQNMVKGNTAYINIVSRNINDDFYVIYSHYSLKDGWTHFLYYMSCSEK